MHPESYLNALKSGCYSAHSISSTLDLWLLSSLVPVDIYVFKVNSGNSRIRCEICSKLAIRAPERRHRRSGVFIVNSEHISHLVLVFLLLTLSRQMPTWVTPIGLLTLQSSSLFYEVKYFRRRYRSGKKLLKFSKRIAEVTPKKLF